MEERNKWWSTLISLGMIAYGIAAIYGTIQGNNLSTTFSSRNMVSLIVPALILLAGLASLAADFMRQPDDTVRGKVSLMLEPYALAWHRLWSTKWLLVVYGVIAAVCAANAISSSVFTKIYKSAMMVSDAGSTGSMSPEMLTFRIFSSAPHWSDNVLQRFFPRMGAVEGAVLGAVALMLLLVWIIPRLVRLGREPEYSSKAGFFGFCIVIATIGLAYGTFLNTTYMFRMLSSLHGPVPHFTPGSFRMLGIADAIMQAIISAALVGGLLGSLARSRNGEAITGNTFLAESVSNFEPLLVVYLILDVLPALMFGSSNSRASFLLGLVFSAVSILSILLMYLPYTLTSRRLSLVGSLSLSLAFWRENAIQTLFLIATGAFFYIVYRAAFDISFVFAPPTTWLYVALSPVFALVGIFLQALILLAVWEFYSEKNVADTRVPVSVV